MVPILRSKARYKVVACGRRFGKTIVGEDRAARHRGVSRPAGSPRSTSTSPSPGDHLSAPARPADRVGDKTERRIDLVTGGRIDFLPMDDPDAGRGRKYKHVVVDDSKRAATTQSSPR